MPSSSHGSVDRQRRALVLAAAGGASLAAAGCCSVPRPTDLPACPNKLGTGLAGPEVRDAWARPERYFDAHTHFFNAADVPVAGFLAKSVAHDVKDSLVKELLIRLAPIVEWVGKTFAQSPSVELAELCSASSRRSLLSLAAQTNELDAEIRSRQDEAAYNLYREILARDLRIPAIINESASRSTLATQGFSEEFIRESFRSGSAVRDPLTNKNQPLERAGLTATDLQTMSLKGQFQFVGFMLSPRHHNLRTYIKEFAAGSPKLPLSGCFGSMVDFNYWLDCPNKASHMRDQVLLHEQLSLMSAGFLLPLVGYNPWVDIEEGGASLETVEWAVKDHGCVGVKIYPPMGFHPYGNHDNPLTGSSEPRPDPKLLDTTLAKFYAKCRELDVPVMAHANHSMGRDDAHDQLAGAAGWRRVDTQLPGLQGLRVNVAHFGGAKDTEGPDATAEFATLMNEAKQIKLFADLGFWDELQTSKDARERLQRALAQRVGATQTVADRAMYGTDWLMLSQVPQWNRYGSDMAALLKDFDPTSRLAQRVLGANALECFGLGDQAPGQNWERLRDHFRQQGYEMPGWMIRRSPGSVSSGD